MKTTTVLAIVFLGLLVEITSPLPNSREVTVVTSQKETTTNCLATFADSNTGEALQWANLSGSCGFLTVGREGRLKYGTGRISGHVVSNYIPN